MIYAKVDHWLLRLTQVDIWERRAFEFYWTADSFKQDLEQYHEYGIRIGEA